MNKNYVGQFVGVVPALAFENLSYPKQLLLMFDAIAINLGGSGLSPRENEIVREMMPEISYLMKEEMLTLLSGLLASNELIPSESSMLNARQTLDSNVVTPERFNAKKLRSKGIDAVPISNPYEDLDIDSDITRDSAVRLTLREFPVPSDLTPWEGIQEFRADKEARDRFWELKKWMNKAGKSGLKQYEVQDELRGLINDYDKSMSLHKLKQQTGTFEVVVTTTASVAEDLVKFKWSSAIKSIFQVQKQDIKLLEDESNLPGKEIAYIANAKSRFAK
ncbi:hypothetical protein [Marinobacter sp. MIT932201]|uniref:hypothetical protein n=1 Tax=Marinobacter sp. MIT932201 TaxID=3096995 RepID=UPI00399A2DAA